MKMLRMIIICTMMFASGCATYVSPWNYAPDGKQYPFIIWPANWQPMDRPAIPVNWCSIHA